MMIKDSINWYSITDQGILDKMGEFIQQTRLDQNKTQQQVAESAGINRATVRQIEKGSGGTLLSLLQILRVLEQLPVLNSFETVEKISPLQIATLDKKKRRRARNNNSATSEQTLNW